MQDGVRDLKKRRCLARSGRRDDGDVLECVQRRREARNLEGALVVAIDHAEVQRDGMPGPSRHALEGRDVGRHRRDRPRRDGIDVVLRRKAQPIDEDLYEGLRGGSLRAFLLDGSLHLIASGVADAWVSAYPDAENITWRVWEIVRDRMKRGEEVKQC